MKKEKNISEIEHDLIEHDSTELMKQIEEAFSGIWITTKIEVSDKIYKAYEEFLFDMPSNDENIILEKWNGIKVLRRFFGRLLPDDYYILYKTRTTLSGKENIMVLKKMSQPNFEYRFTNLSQWIKAKETFFKDNDNTDK